MEEKTYSLQNELFTRIVQAGKRRYYFDIRKDEKGPLISITESTRRFNNRDGKFYYERNRVVVYPQDLDHFIDAFIEAGTFLREYLRQETGEREAEENSGALPNE
jgi:hypothetical protein